VETAGAELMDVRFVSGEAYEVAAGRYLTRHGYSRDGLGVSVSFDMAADRPARVATVRLTVRVPADLPAGRRPALAAVVSRCTVHNSLTIPPGVTIDLV
jgi:uncharacterized OsmC-like protein